MYQLKELYKMGNALSRFLMFVRLKRVEFLNSSGDVSGSLICAKGTPPIPLKSRFQVPLS